MGNATGWEATSELARRIELAFEELKRGVESLQRTVEEVVVAMPELSSSLIEIEKALTLLGRRSPGELPERLPQ
jgi:hypothetical protein